MNTQKYYVVYQTTVPVVLQYPKILPYSVSSTFQQPVFNVVADISKSEVK